MLMPAVQNRLAGSIAVFCVVVLIALQNGFAGSVAVFIVLVVLIFIFASQNIFTGDITILFMMVLRAFQYRLAGDITVLVMLMLTVQFLFRFNPFAVPAILVMFVRVLCRKCGKRHRPQTHSQCQKCCKAAPVQAFPFFLIFHSKLPFFAKTSDAKGPVTERALRQRHFSLWFCVPSFPMVCQIQPKLSHRNVLRLMAFVSRRFWRICPVQPNEHRA